VATTPEDTSEYQLGIADAFAWLVVAQLGSALWFGIVAAVFHNGATPDPLPLTTLFTLQLAFVVAYGVGPWWSSRYRGNGPGADYRVSVKIGDLPLGIVCGVFTQLIVIALYFPILRFVDSDPGDAARRLTSQVDDTGRLLLLVLMVVVLAPAVEEFYFRGLFLRTLAPHIGLWPTVGVQALVFAAVHYQLLQFPGLVVVGLVAGALAVRTGRLGASWAMHASFNGITLFFLMI
jgi:uncharacterized protein